jgi:CubicO group peptidase (beta-lactamase class C family)
LCSKVSALSDHYPGGLIYDKAIGLDSVKEGARPIDSLGVMWIASCTKLLTSIAALQLVERGLITLDEPASRVVPELSNIDVITADSAAPNGFILRPAKENVTLRQLITHTSGVGYEMLSPLLQSWRKTQPPGSTENLGKTATTFATPLLFEPGEGWVYGGGLDWTGEIVSRLTGKTLGEYFEEKIFKPLGGWKSTTFSIDQKPDLEKRIVGCARRNHKGELEHMDAIGFPKTVAEHSGGHGLWSTAPDYMKILTDLLKDEPTVLKKETVESLVFSPQLTNESALRGLAPAEAGINYGLGGVLLTKDADPLPKGTLTGGGAPNIKWFISRDRGVAALYASQIMPPEDPKSTALSMAYFKEILRLNKEQQ